ncbi:MAG: FixH family protein [Bacteriovorax sp.]
MKKKVLVILLTAFVCFAFIKLKERYSIKATNHSQFLILNWRMTPSYVTDLGRPVTFTFHLKDRQNRPIEDASISIEANMNHPGMTPIEASATHDQNGFYKTSFKLTMEGDWILFLTIKRPNGVIIKKELLFNTRPNK